MQDEFDYVDTTPVNDESMTRAQVANALDLHVTEVRRIEQRALEKLRRKLILHPRYEEITEHQYAGKNWLPRMF
jgi:hypothetical protein